MNTIEFSEEAEQGSGELKMTDANSSLMEKQFFKLAKHKVNTLQACKGGKKILDDKFESVGANVEICEMRMHTDTHRVDVEVSPIGSQLHV
jgi:hypothetical protein